MNYDSNSKLGNEEEGTNGSTGWAVNERVVLVYQLLEMERHNFPNQRI